MATIVASDGNLIDVSDCKGILESNQGSNITTIAQCVVSKAAVGPAIPTTTPDTAHSPSPTRSLFAELFGAILYMLYAAFSFILGFLVVATTIVVIWAILERLRTFSVRMLPGIAPSSAKKASKTEFDGYAFVVVTSLIGTLLYVFVFSWLMAGYYKPPAPATGLAMIALALLAGAASSAVLAVGTFVIVALGVVIVWLITLWTERKTGATDESSRFLEAEH